MLQRLHRTRRRLARATLAGFALFWALTALSPCVMAAPCMGSGMSVPCANSGDLSQKQPPCDTAAMADCQKIDQNLLDKSASTDKTNLHTPVLLHTVAPSVQTPGLYSTLQHQRNAAAVPYPPLNLKHAILLI